MDWTITQRYHDTLARRIKAPSVAVQGMSASSAQEAKSEHCEGYGEYPMTRLFSYTIPVDDGAAPNPLHGICTLAICKPTIRRVAKKGDWIAGLGSKDRGLDGRLVYAMLVNDAISLEEYDRRAETEWPHRIPTISDDPTTLLGDCIYNFSAGKSPYQRFGVHGPENRETDLGGENALIALEFYYFGKNAVPLPRELLPIIHQTQGHKSNANDSYVPTFEYWIRRHEVGKHGDPDIEIDWEDLRAGGSCKACAKERPDDPVC
jgi:Nucleotide modification associated domain 2